LETLGGNAVLLINGPVSELGDPCCKNWTTAVVSFYLAGYAYVLTYTRANSVDLWSHVSHMQAHIRRFLDNRCDLFAHLIHTRYERDSITISYKQITNICSQHINLLLVDLLSGLAAYNYFKLIMQCEVYDHVFIYLYY